MPSDPKPKAKKKAKKAKFKSLKKRSLASELKSVKEEPLADAMSMDEENVSDEVVTCSDMSMLKKRKKAEITEDSEGEKISKKKSKKFKKAPLQICSLEDTNLSGMQHEPMDSKLSESVFDSEHKPVSRSKMGGKISITPMSLKRVLMIKPEKLKKGNIWSRDCVPSPDFWLPQEDAILCAVVHEYGPHWSLVSEILYGMTAGGFYRGRYRHPVHCCERFRELIQRYVLSTDNPNYEKVSYMGSGKALLKVTEVGLVILNKVSINFQNWMFDAV